MRRVTRASQASGGSEAPLVLSGDEDGVAPPPRIPPEEKERLRQMQKACTLRMYDHAVAYFMRTLQRTKTEGVGDCWLLSIMGGFEVKDPKLVKEVDDAQRHTICTARRHAIVVRRAVVRGAGLARAVPARAAVLAAAVVLAEMATILRGRTQRRPAVPSAAHQSGCVKRRRSRRRRRPRAGTPRGAAAVRETARVAVARRGRWRGEEHRCRRSLSKSF